MKLIIKIIKEQKSNVSYLLVSILSLILFILFLVAIVGCTIPREPDRHVNTPAQIQKYLEKNWHWGKKKPILRDQKDIVVKDVITK